MGEEIVCAGFKRADRRFS